MMCDHKPLARAICIPVVNHKKQTLIFSEPSGSYCTFYGLVFANDKIGPGNHIFFCSCIWRNFMRPGEETPLDIPMGDVEVATKASERFESFHNHLEKRKHNGFARCTSCLRVGCWECYTQFDDNNGHVYCSSVCGNWEADDMIIENEDSAPRRCTSSDNIIEEDIFKGMIYGLTCRVSDCGTFCKYNGISSCNPRSKQENLQYLQRVRCKICNQQLHSECHDYYQFDGNVCTNIPAITNPLRAQNLSIICNNIACLTAAYKLMIVPGVTWQKFMDTKKVVGRDAYYSICRLIDVRKEIVVPMLREEGCM